MKNRLFSLSTISLSSFLLLAPMSVFAGAESGFYVGLGVGNSTIAVTEPDPSDPSISDFDENDSGYKVFVGFNLGIIPLIDLAVEAAYVDFGNPSSLLNNGIPFDVEITGVSTFGLAGVSFGPIGVFAKAGFISWDSDFSVGTLSGSDSGTDPAYGVGARFQISSLAIRAEIETYDVGDLDDLYMLSASLVYTY